MLAKWEDKTFGKSGRFFPFLYMAPIPIFVVAAVLLSYSLLAELILWERVIIMFFSVFFFYYFAKSLEAIKIARSTAKTIIRKNKHLAIYTYSGKYLDSSLLYDIDFNSCLFNKKNVRFIFSKDAPNVVLCTRTHKYYISGKITGIQEIIQALQAQRRSDSHQLSRI